MGHLQMVFRPIHPFWPQCHVFFWSDDLSRQDAELFFNMVDNAEVVILGGGEVHLVSNATTPWAVISSMIMIGSGTRFTSARTPAN
jgi:hypothetical protein